MSLKQKITILGSTGSIGKNTLDVISYNLESFEIFALTAFSQVDILFEQIKQFKPKYAVLVNSKKASILKEKVTKERLKTEILSGEDALIEVACDNEVDVIMAAIVGSAGLKPTYYAAKKGKRILLANKETLIASGALFMDVVKESGAKVIPVDSEHSAIFQCLPENNKKFSLDSMESIILTASGGPFRDYPLEKFDKITPEQAVAHPNWSMGAKISIDSATMVNKSLEMLEAFWLFDVPEDKLKVIIHPQSIIHSMVHYKDGSYMAQLGSHDMRTPISYALFYPKRQKAVTKPLNFFEHQLSFEPVCFKRFKAVQLMYQIMQSDDLAFYSIVFNAVNEVLVSDFLANKISFRQITEGIDSVLNQIKPEVIKTIDDVFEMDKKARVIAQSEILA